jgi:hypothetical protein
MPPGCGAPAWCAHRPPRAVAASGLGEPSYVITGRFPDTPETGGDEDVAAAEYIEHVRLGSVVDGEAVRRRVRESRDWERTLALGAGHVHPDDVVYATRIDAFPFAMEAVRTPEGIRLTASRP